MIWFDLSDSELRARLTQRGVPHHVAALAVARRDHRNGAELINRRWLR